MVIAVMMTCALGMTHCGCPLCPDTSGHDNAQCPGCPDTGVRYVLKPDTPFSAAENPL